MMKLLSHITVLGIGIAIGLTLSSGRRPYDRNVVSNIPGAETGVKAEVIPLTSPHHLEKSVPTADDAQVVRGSTPKDEFERTIGSGDFEGASAALREMAREPNNSVDVLEGRGRLFVRQRKWNDAKEALQQCLESYPKSQSCLVDMASTELQVGSKDEQSKAVYACLLVTPNDLQCRNMAAIVKMSQGKYGEAVQIYERLIQDNGSYGVRFDEAMLNWQLGLALEGAGKLKDASENFYKACRKNFPDACKKYEDIRSKL